MVSYKRINEVWAAVLLKLLRQLIIGWLSILGPVSWLTPN